MTGARGQRGFTLAEMTVACTIVAIALLGVYGFSRRVTSVAAEQTAAWHGRATAQPVAEEIARTAERIVAVQDYKPLLTQSRDGGGSVILHTPTARVRYRWYPQENLGLSVDKQVMAFSGSKCIQPDVPALEEDEKQKDFDTDRRWDAVPSIRVGQALSSVSVSYKRRKQEGERKKKPLGPGVIWIRIGAEGSALARPVEVGVSDRVIE